MSLSLPAIVSASVTIAAAVKLATSKTSFATVVEILVVPVPVTSPVNVIVSFRVAHAERLAGLSKES